MPRDVMEGLLASEDLRHTHNLHGVAGCLVDVLEVPPQLVTAADVVAGNQLFQVRGLALQCSPAGPGHSRSAANPAAGACSGAC